MNESTKKIVTELVLESASAALVRDKPLSEDTRFYDLGIDSIAMLSILLRLEDKLAVSLMDLGEQLEAPATLGELFVIVASLQKSQIN